MSSSRILRKIAMLDNFFIPAIKELLPFFISRGSSENADGDVATNEVSAQEEEEVSIEGKFQYQDFSFEEIDLQEEPDEENEEVEVEPEQENIEDEDQKTSVVTSRATPNDTELDFLFGAAYDTYSFDREAEVKNCLRKNFLNGCNISPHQRKQTLKWLLVTFRSLNCFELIPEVHHLTVAIFDRYLQAEKKIPSKHLKLVAISSILIAVKMEEGLSTKITLEDCVILTTCKFSRPEVAQMEEKILKTLNFRLIIPSSYHFLARCNLITDASEIEKFFGMYLLEIGFSSYDICYIRPSLQAAAAHFIITVLATDPIDLNRVWSPGLRYYTEYYTNDLKPVVRLLAAELYRITKKAEDNLIFSKYADDKFGQISTMLADSLPWIQKLKNFK